MDFWSMFSRHCCCKSNVNLQSCLVHVAYHSHLCVPFLWLTLPTESGLIGRSSSLYTAFLPRLTICESQMPLTQRAREGTARHHTGWEEGPNQLAEVSLPCSSLNFYFHSTDSYLLAGEFEQCLWNVLSDQVGNLRSLCSFPSSCFTFTDSAEDKKINCPPWCYKWNGWISGWGEV